MNLKEKQLAINETGALIAKYQPNVESIYYDVFTSKYTSHSGSVYEYTCEYLVIEYKGGAKTVRNCRGNSYSAILNELVSFLDHGYYSELDAYKEDKALMIKEGCEE